MLTPFIQLYGSGHVHGLQHNGNALLDFERDALHRETGRTLQGSGDHTLTIRRRWDALGRLQALASQGLQRHITHTVYEPETFTPLVQLSAKASAQARPHALMLAVHGDGGDDEGSAQMAQMLQALPGDMRHLLDRNIRQAAREGLPEHILALMPDQGESALRSARNMRKQLEKQEQSQRTEITVRHYHCDHLGTPIALTDEKQNIVWAARLDPWGNVQEEFNPDNIEQSIRLPGQHQDKDTGLYYNRHRYYDPSIGSYVNQDPIGLMGGSNKFAYPTSPTSGTDPLGLFDSQKCASIKSRIDNLNKEIWDKRYPDLKSNPGKLPYRATPGSLLRDTVQGHEILLTIALRNLDKAWKDWYDNGCDKPPPPPSPTCSTCETKDSKTVETVATVGALAVGGYIAYKLVRAVAISFIATPVAGVGSLALP